MKEYWCSLLTVKKTKTEVVKKKNIKQEKKCSHGVHEARRESESLGKKRR